MICSMGGRKQRLLRASFPCSTARTCQEKKSNLEREPLQQGWDVTGSIGQPGSSWHQQFCKYAIQSRVGQNLDQTRSGWQRRACQADADHGYHKFEKLPRVDVVLVGMKTTGRVDGQCRNRNLDVGLEAWMINMTSRRQTAGLETGTIRTWPIQGRRKGLLRHPSPLRQPSRSR